MTRWTVLMIAAAAALTQPALAQTSDGVPGDRVVVPLPDVSGLSDDEAQALARDVAQMTVITAECPEHDVSGPEFQLMAGTTDALTERLGDRFPGLLHVCDHLGDKRSETRTRPLGFLIEPAQGRELGNGGHVLTVLLRPEGLVGVFIRQAFSHRLLLLF